MKYCKCLLTVMGLFLMGLASTCQSAVLLQENFDNPSAQSWIVLGKWYVNNGEYCNSYLESGLKAWRTTADLPSDSTWTYEADIKCKASNIPGNPSFGDGGIFVSESNVAPKASPAKYLGFAVVQDTNGVYLDCRKTGNESVGWSSITTASPTGTYHLKMELLDPSTGTVRGTLTGGGTNLVLDVTFADIAACKYIGVNNYRSEIGVDNVNVASGGSTLYSEDFSSGTTNGWSQDVPDWSFITPAIENSTAGVVTSAMKSESLVPAGSAWSYEADVKFVSGNYGNDLKYGMPGLFLSTDNTNPLNGSWLWFAVGLSSAGARICIQNTGYGVLAQSDITTLSPTGEYHITVSRVSGSANDFVATLSGGGVDVSVTASASELSSVNYAGVVNYCCDATFDNIKLKSGSSTLLDGNFNGGTAEGWNYVGSWSVNPTSAGCRATQANCAWAQSATWQTDNILPADTAWSYEADIDDVLDTNIAAQPAQGLLLVSSPSGITLGNNWIGAFVNHTDAGIALTYSNSSGSSSITSRTSPSTDGKYHLKIERASASANTLRMILKGGGSDLVLLVNDPLLPECRRIGLFDYFSNSIFDNLLVKSIPTIAPIGINDGKTSVDGTTARFSGMIVTAVFGDEFYAEASDRHSGIMIKKTDHMVSVGNSVDVTGALATKASGERYIDANDGALAVGAGEELKPVGVTNRALGGGAIGTPPAGQKGVKDGVGLNTIGLLMRTTGKVTKIDSSNFMLDDGSGVGVKVTGPSGCSPATGDYTAVSGISSIDPDNGGRLLKLRAFSDVTGSSALFGDDFYSGNAGSWVFDGIGAWSVAGGTLRNVDGGAGFTAAWQPNALIPAGSNWCYEADAKYISGNGNGPLYGVFSLVVRPDTPFTFSDSGSGVYFGIEQANGGSVRCGVYNTAYQTIATSPYASQVSPLSYHIKLSANGTTGDFTVVVTGASDVITLTGNASQLVGARYIGLCNYSCIVDFDNVVLTLQ